MRLVGGDFDGEHVNWTGDRTFPMYQKVAIPPLASAVDVENMRTTQNPKRTVYRVQRIVGDGMVFQFARPEHWTDAAALQHLFGPPTDIFR